MKKWIAIMLVMVTLFAMAACGKQNTEQPENKETKPGSSNKTEQTEPSVQQTTAPAVITPETWGVETSFLTKKDGNSLVYCVNTPNYTGNNVGRGNVTEQMDGTLTLVSGQMDHSPEAVSLAELFVTYQEQVQYTLRKVFGVLSENYAFTFDKGEPVTVGDYDMYVFRGKVSFTDDKTPRTLPFVAYATVLKGNGAYAYWMVFDITGNNGAADLLEQHAYNMALTCRETK